MFPAKCLAVCVVAAMSLMAQPPGPGQRGPGPGWDHEGPGGGRPPMRMGMGGGGRWWTDPTMVQKLSLTDDQQKRLTDAFLQNRLKLVELSAAVQKEELLLEPLLAVDRPDEFRAAAQIDRVAQARAELEKANGRMLLGMRSVLTPEQWKKLQAERPGPGSRRRPEGGEAGGDPQSHPRRQ